MKAAVIGASGYGGAELIRLLIHHPHLKLNKLYSSSKDHVPISAEYPHLSDICDLELTKLDPDQIAEEADVVFLAVPSGASAKLVPELLKNDVKVVDLSGDLRLKNPEDYKNWYKKTPADMIVYLLIVLIKYSDYSIFFTRETYEYRLKLW